MKLDWNAVQRELGEKPPHVVMDRRRRLLRGGRGGGSRHRVVLKFWISRGYVGDIRHAMYARSAFVRALSLRPK